jgi:hypothetical protein
MVCQVVPGRELRQFTSVHGSVFQVLKDSQQSGKVRI